LLPNNPSSGDLLNQCLSCRRSPPPPPSQPRRNPTILQDEEHTSIWLLYRSILKNVSMLISLFQTRHVLSTRDVATKIPAMIYLVTLLSKKFDSQHSHFNMTELSRAPGVATSFQLSQTGARFVARNVAYNPTCVLFLHKGITAP
jgi:hypothetical protein